MTPLAALFPPSLSGVDGMLRGVLLWMLGIPIPIIILLFLFLD